MSSSRTWTTRGEDVEACPRCGERMEIRYVEAEGLDVWRSKRCVGCGYHTPRRLVPAYVPWLIAGAYLAALACLVAVAALYGTGPGLLTLVGLAALKLGSAAGRKYFD